MTEVKIIKDSIAEDGKRLTTFQLRYWRAIHAEVLTHRVFSRNASSSRAIPVKKMLKQVWSDPSGPIHWGANQSGMQAKRELKGIKLFMAKLLWNLAGKVMCVFAGLLMLLGLHKQVANRLLEPWQYIHVVLSATEFGNWFELRDHGDAQPEIQELARMMRKAMNNSTPELLEEGQWHLPYITEYDRGIVANRGGDVELLKKISAARCCRVSYLKHDGTISRPNEDIALCDKLAASRPIHASPFEHIATPAPDAPNWQWGNFVGWKQYRKEIEVRLA